MYITDLTKHCTNVELKDDKLIFTVKEDKIQEVFDELKAFCSIARILGECTSIEYLNKLHKKRTKLK